MSTKRNAAKSGSNSRKETSKDLATNAFGRMTTQTAKKMGSESPKK